MIEHITPDRIANAILQDNSYKGLYVLVEGKKDCKLYSKFLDLKNTRVRPTFGCDKLIQVFDILNKRGFDKKIGILDKDFFEFYGTLPQLENVFFTDYHDIEVMIFVTKALDDVLRIYTFQEKVEEFEKKTGKGIREIIFELSDKIGYLKLIEKKYGFGLKFKPDTVDGKQIKYSDFISDKMVYNGDDSLISSIINYSRNKTDKKLINNEIKEKYISEKLNKYESKHLSNGHDISNIVFLFLKKTVRSTNGMLNDYNSVEDSLILAYEFEDFKKTELYKSLLIWSDNKSIPMFRKN